MSENTEFVQALITGPDWINNQGLQQILDDEYNKALQDSLTRGRRILKSEIEASGATATRTLFNSVADKITERTMGDFLYAGDIFFRGRAETYADNADKGRGPGRVPPSNQILVWMKAKGIDEKYLWPIMMTLAKEGTQTKFWNLYDRSPFLDSAVAKIDADINQRFEEASQRIRLRMENAPSVEIK